MTAHLSHPHFAGTVFLIAFLVPAMPVAAADVPPATRPASAPASVIDRAVALLAEGHQSRAENLITDRLRAAVAARQSPDAEDVFFIAVCTRSRFQVDDAATLFSYVAEAAPNSPQQPARPGR